MATIEIDGRAYRDLDDRLRHVGAMLEASSFHPGRSGTDHLAASASSVHGSASRFCMMPTAVTT